MHLGRLHWFRISSDLNLDTIAANRHKQVSNTVVGQITSITVHALYKPHFQTFLYFPLLTQYNSAAVIGTKLNGTFNAQDYIIIKNGVNATVNAQDDVAVNTSQPLANLLVGHFNDICPIVGQLRLRKRVLTDFDVGCVKSSAFSLAKYAGSSAAVQQGLSSIPTSFSVKGQLLTVVNQVKAMIQQQQPQLLSTRLFSPLAILSTLSYLASLAYVVWKYGPGTQITQIVIPYVDVETVSSSSCSSWTFSWTSPTPSTTVVVT